MKKLSFVFLIALGFSLTGCSDKTDEIKNDETYFQGEWTVTRPQVIVDAGNPVSVSGFQLAYSFQKGGKLEIQRPMVQPVQTEETGTGAVVITGPASLWSYVSDNRQLLLFIPQKEVYDIIQVDKNHFKAIGEENGYQWDFSRK